MRGAACTCSILHVDDHLMYQKVLPGLHFLLHLINRIKLQVTAYCGRYQIAASLRFECCCHVNYFEILGDHSLIDLERVPQKADEMTLK